MDGKVSKYIDRAKKIAQDKGLAHTPGSKVIDPAVIIGIAAMLQLEEMSAPMIVIDHEGKAKNLDIKK